MRLWTYTRREVERRPGRAALTLLGIVIGVAAVVSVAVATATARSAFRDMFETVAGRAALEVVAQGDAGFDESVLSKIEGTPGIAAAVPLIWSPGVLIAGEARNGVVVLGIDPERDHEVRDYVLAEGEFFTGGKGLLLEKSYAAGAGLSVGETAFLLTPRGIAPVPVAGLLEPEGAAAFSAAGLVFLALPEAQRLFGLQGRLNSVNLVLAEGADEEEVAQAIRERLPEGLEVREPLARGALAKDFLLSTEQGLANSGVLSLVAGAFIILNSFLMNLGERRRHLAILRALGATRRQIRLLLLGEGLAMGLAGTILGMGAGLGGAWALTRFLETMLGVRLAGLKITAQPFLLAALLGPGISLAGVLVPALRAGKVSPLEGLARESPAAASSRRRKWPFFAGLGALAVAFALAAGFMLGRLPAELSPLSLVVGLVGCVLIIPAGVGPLARIVSRALSGFLGVEGDLAERQLVRNRTRTSLTVGVLFVAIAVGIGMGNSILANIRDVRDWYERAIVGDFFVRGSLPDAATGRAFALSEDVGRDIAALPGVAGVDRVRFLSAELEDRRVIVLARDFPEGRPLPIDLFEGEPEEIRAGLARGGAVLGTALARALGVSTGDVVTIQTLGGPRDIPVVGLCTEYMVGGSALYMGYEPARRLMGFEGVDAFAVRAEPGKAALAGEQIEALAKERGFMFQSLADVRRYIEALMAGVVGFLWLLLALSFLVAAFGIVNTLTMNVLEQTRELGLLRAVAMTRGQVRKMVLAQAILLGLISLAPGVGAGIAIAFLMNLGTVAVLGQPVDFALDPVLLAGSFAVALAITIAAAFLPARRAARLNVVEALQYE
ncbi:MAG: ABC transporter permease [Planctomycetes bacterium]|nr:ABC transporter permease [Planctomycetota bacterium]